MKRTDQNRRTLMVASLTAFAAVVALVVVLSYFGPNRGISYTGSAGNPSGSGSAVTLVTPIPAGQRQPVPSQNFMGGDGTTFDLRNFNGQTVLVNYWATWCPPCIAEMPALDSLQAQLGGPNFQVIAISLDRGGAEVAGRWLRHNGLTHLAVYTADPAHFADAVLPTSQLIDGHGRIAWNGKGARAWDHPAVVTAIEAIIAETAH